MITDPYKVLGVSPNVTDAELKKAYRDLSKKWHPDQHPDNEAQATEKFKEIQEAYRQIVDAREKGTSPYGPGASGGSAGYGSQGYGSQNYGPFGGYGYRQENNSGSYGYQDYKEYNDFNDFFRGWSSYSEQQRRAGQENEYTSNEIRAALNYINSGYYDQAMNALNQVRETERTAQWYYVAALASERMGNNIDALNYAKRAADLEPDNMQYRNYLQALQNGGSWYQQRGMNYGGTGNMSSATTWCLGFICLNLFCPGAFCCI